GGIEWRAGAGAEAQGGSECDGQRHVRRAAAHELRMPATPPARQPDVDSRRPNGNVVDRDGVPIGWEMRRKRQRTAVGIDVDAEQSANQRSEHHGCREELLRYRGVERLVQATGDDLWIAT